MSKQQITDVTVTQVKRHRKKPRVSISLTRVKKMLRNAEVNVQKEHSYLLYACGHIYDSEDDPANYQYIKGTNRKQRSCPVCVSSPLLTKYKKCGCNAEHIGKRVQASKCCSSCISSRRAAKGETPECLKRANDHLADDSRCFCIHREACLIKYRKCNVVPCKGCKDFTEGEWVKDPA